jgi:hypothetical protein
MTAGWQMPMLKKTAAPTMIPLKFICQLGYVATKLGKNVHNQAIIAETKGKRMTFGIQFL